ncbi:RNA polymerase subunit sigma-24 [Cryobacterium sp. N22]|uniref:RNA polymerase subunit sigma-24 n=1 Tax=Cryobacterium sp. N22 TaxID=2048290 RepID=UPI000CE4FF99|nr:RNA polymerase subunit sigma-24 [Cryobacterium sp. N22]
MTSGEPASDALSAERPRLLDIALRILGSIAEADRAVERTFTLWREAPAAERDAGVSLRDQLTEILARTCVDALRQARLDRGQYVGDWLPEPLPHLGAPRTPGGTDPVDRISLDESLNMLLLVVLESLTPEARVAFILHDVFGVPFGGIADVVGRSPEATRELARSARREIHHRREHDAPGERHRALVLDFLAGCAAQDEAQVRSRLHPDIAVIIDGGGKVSAAPSPTRGVEQAARLLIRVISGVPALAVTEQSVNGQAGLVFRRDQRVVGVMSVSVRTGTIRDVWIVLNPDKLRHWNAD